MTHVLREIGHLAVVLLISLCTAKWLLSAYPVQVTCIIETPDPAAIVIPKERAASLRLDR